MEWTFQLTAADRPRLESRLLQVLDQKMVVLNGFSSVRAEREIRVRITAMCDDAHATRIVHLLRRLEDVRQVHLHPEPLPVQAVRDALLEGAD